MQLKFSEPKKPIKPWRKIERSGLFFDFLTKLIICIFYLPNWFRLQLPNWFLKPWDSCLKKKREIKIHKKVFVKIFWVFFWVGEKLHFRTTRIHNFFPKYFAGPEQEKRDESFTHTRSWLSAKQKDRKSMNKHFFLSWDETERRKKEKSLFSRQKSSLIRFFRTCFRMWSEEIIRRKLFKVNEIRLPD